MRTYSQKLISLLVRSVLFGLVGGSLFTIIAGATAGIFPYIAFMGLGAGWSMTRPLGIIAVGKDGIIFTSFFFAVRVGIALIVGWLVMIPYTWYLIVKSIRE